VEPPRVTSSRVVYENRWMRLHEDRTERTDGAPGLYAWVEKPPAAVVVPRDGGHVWLVEQFRHPIGERFWEFPQGAWEDEPGAVPEDLARGELAEETGLRAGRIEQAGSPTTLYADPGNTFVAGFIGSPKMNLLTGAANADGTVAFGGITIVPAIGQKLAAGQKVTIGIRPEQFDEAGIGGADLSAAVDVVENLGGASVVYGRLSDGQTIVIEQRGGQRARIGERIEVGFRPGDALIFDEAGRRVR
jgi:hypothetical protein